MKKLFAITIAALMCAMVSTAQAQSVPANPLDEPRIDVNARIDEIMARMTIEQKVYQMFIIAPESLTGVRVATQAGETTEKALKKYPVGGLIYFAENLESPNQAKKMLGNTASYAAKIGMPGLFFGVDEEGGKVARCASKLGTTEFPPMMTIAEDGDPQRVYDAYQTIARDIAQFGFNLDFAPVADVITNPDNTEIGDRAFGTDAGQVADMVEYAVLGLQDQGVSAAAKHFPGHGNTSVNSHYATTTTDRTLDEMRGLELLPFQAAIGADVDMVLISHLTAVNVDDSAPASLNSAIITGILRDEMGYDGIVITDALQMSAVADHYTPNQIAQLAVNAGVDVLLMPADFQATSAALIDMVKRGEIGEERIDQSVRRILTVKLRREIAR